MSASGEITATLDTARGEIRLRLFPDRAPVTVASFVNLARRGFFDDLAFHRVIADFMIQGGCPRGNGRGGPGYRFEDECHPDLNFDRPGLLAMANAGPRTNGSQFFITHGPTGWLDQKHTIFGEVVGPADQRAVDGIEQGDAIRSVAIEGDLTVLLADQAQRIVAWDETLAEGFPDLLPPV